MRFLGTGPAGGRPGRGRSRRTESSLAIADGGSTILVDVTRDFAAQARHLDTVDLVLITHAHRDASGGVARLARWLAGRPVPLWSAPATIDALARRYRRLAPLELRAVRRPRRWRDFAIAPLVVPHALDCTTLAWRIARAGRTLVYASDVARLGARLAALSAGCDLLVLDGACWKRRIFTHLEIASAARIVAGWQVGRVRFTQLGRSTPDHAELDRWLRAFDPRFGAAHDGLEITL